jgi:energy-coupling factor transport system substrate-specific component
MFKNLKVWKLQDVILASVLSAFFAAVCLGTVLSLIGPAIPLFAALGLADLSFEVMFGVFLMSAVFTPYIIQKPGVATVVGFLTGYLQVLMGSPFAATVWLSGLVQGFGAEVGFALFAYQKWNLLSVLIAATGASVASFLLAWQRGSWTYLTFEIVALRFMIRWASAGLISGLFSKYLADRLAKAGVLKSYPLGVIHDEFTGE